MNYQGPNVQVTQTFLATPPAIAVENLPPAGIGTAYDVYSKELLGSVHGIADTECLWGVDKVIYDENVIGERLYNFYPVNVYANTSDFGNIVLSVEKTSTGVTVTDDDQFEIPGTNQAVGISEAFIPYYNKNLGTGNVKILSTDLTKITAIGATFVTSKIQSGQKVMIGDSTIPGSLTVVGSVGSIGSDEQTIRLSAPYSVAITGDIIIIGATSTSLTMACYLYDPNANFIANKVKVGDVVNFESNAITGSFSASITSVTKNMVQFFTGVQSDYDYYQTYSSNADPASTVEVSTYNITRLVGYSQKYHFDDGGGTQCVRISDVSFGILQSLGKPLLNKGDYIAITSVLAHSATTCIYKIDTATTGTITFPTTTSAPTTTTAGPTTTPAPAVVYQIYTVTDVIYEDDNPSTKFDTDDYVLAWHPINTNNILADFRAVRMEEHLVAKRITSAQDIVTAWCKDNVISPYNELAYAVFCAWTSAGGNVCYGVSVDSTAINLAEEYSEALEELKMIDLYTHFTCTTNSGVNALMSPYCLEESDPYEAHERTAILCYDSEDVYLQGSDTGTITDGLITVSLNLPVIGVNKGDVVEIYDETGVYKETVNVTSTPTTLAPTECQTDCETVYSNPMIFKFLSNRKDDQAVRIGALGLGDRRIKIVWPGWFNANFGTTAMTVPPYYLTACKAGMDSINNPSQSFTNKNFVIPGFSNIQLGTNSYFKKSQLDVIGGGGVDITIQDGSISQTIRSRHDLTTNMDAVEYREWSITKQGDTSAKVLRNAIQPYVGKYNITGTLIVFITQVCSIVASTLVKKGIISNMNILSVARDANIADKININVKVTVFVAGNYYDITMLIVSR